MKLLWDELSSEVGLFGRGATMSIGKVEAA